MRIILKEEQRTAVKVFSQQKRCFCITPDWLWQRLNTTVHCGESQSASVGASVSLCTNRKPGPVTTWLSWPVKHPEVLFNHLPSRFLNGAPLSEWFHFTRRIREINLMDTENVPFGVPG